MTPSQKWVNLGKVQREWGVRGQVKCISYNPESTLFSRLKKIFLKEGPSYRSFTLENAKSHGKYWLLKLSGYENPEDAKSLRGALLALPREELPELEPGEVYLTDLEGMNVLSPQGSALGTVRRFQRVGETEVMAVERPGGEIVEVPYERDFIRTTSKDRREIIITDYAMELFESNESH